MFSFPAGYINLIIVILAAYQCRSFDLKDEMPDNEASRLLLSSKSPLEFVNNIITIQTTNQVQYQQVIPYFYTPDAQFIRGKQVFNGVDEILNLYKTPPISSKTKHDFLMDPVIEENKNDSTYNVAMTSNVLQERLLDTVKGKDYSYPLYLSLLLTFDLKIKRLLYNFPYYALDAVPSVLVNGKYLPSHYTSIQNNYIYNMVYSMWSDLKIINSDYVGNVEYGELWKPYFSNKNGTKLIFQNKEYNGIDEIVEFHNNLSKNIFGGFRFYIISLIINKDFITVHLRGSVMSSDLRINYNDNFRMVIEYNINEMNEIYYANYRIDTQQFKEIKEKFNICSDF